MSLVTKPAHTVINSEKTVLAFIKSRKRCLASQIIAETGLSKYAVHESVRRLRKREQISVVEYIRAKKTIAAVYAYGIHDEPDDPRQYWKKPEPEEPFIWQPHVANTKWLSCVGQLEAHSKTLGKAANRAVDQLS